MSSSSATQFSSPVKAVKQCHCEKPSIIRTSWTESNPGRRFHGCETYGMGGGCGFFEWYDPPICYRSIKVIPGLLRRVRCLEVHAQGLEAECRSLSSKLRVYRTITIISCIVAAASLLTCLLQIGNCGK